MSQLYDALVYSKNPTNVIQYSTLSNSRNVGGGIVILLNGILICGWAYFKSESEDLTITEIWACKSLNNGKTWHDPYVIITPAADTSETGNNFYQKSNGDIILITLVRSLITPFWGQLWQYISSDNGLTFTGGKLIYESDDYVVTGDYLAPGCLFKTNSGRLILPFSVAKTTNIYTATGNYVGKILYSDDEGDTWSLSTTTIEVTTGGTYEYLLVNPHVSQLLDNSLIIGFQTRSGYIRFSTSSNNGATWSNPPTKSGTLKGSNAAIAMKYVNDKLIMVVCRSESGDDHTASSATRINLDLWKSENNGSTWSFVKNIANSNSKYVYSDPFIFDKGNSILVIYSKYPYDITLGSLQDLIFTEVNYNEF